VRIAFIIISLLVSSGLFAQEPKLTAKVSKDVVGLSEPFKYVVTITNDRGKITLPKIADFTIVQGPSVSSNYSIIQGKTTQEYSETYLLKPKRIGKYKIGQAVASTSKGVIKSNAVVVEVVKGQAPPPQPKSTAELIASVEVDKRKIYAGEPVVVSYKVYTRYREFGAEEILYPGTDGFWAEDVEISSDWKTESIQGKTYYSIEAKRQILFPQTTGTLEIGEFSLTAVCRERWYSSTKRLSSTSNPIKIEVLPLPSGKDENHIGSFSPLTVNAKLSTDEVKANEAINFTVTLEGKGNLKLLDEPAFDFPSDLEIFDPKVKDNINVHSYGESGSRTFEYVIIPRSPGEYEIPAVNLSYYDYGKKNYKTVSTGNIGFNVLKGEGGSGQSYTYDSKTQVNILNQDIRFIKRDSGKLRASNTPFYGTLTFMLLMAFPAGAFLMVLLVKRKKEQAEMDVEGTRTKRAAKVARKHLKEASALVSSGDNKLFFETLYKAIFGYLADKFSIPQSELTKEYIHEKLEASAGKSTTVSTLQLIEECEMARFAPVTSETTSQTLDRATELISNIERGK
jgi:hypothetical protein